MVRMQLSGDWNARMKSFLALPEARGLKGELPSVLNVQEVPLALLNIWDAGTMEAPVETVKETRV